MSAGRRKARRQAVFFLYQRDLLRLGGEEVAAKLQASELDEYGGRIVNGVCERETAIDELIGGSLQGWRVDRLGVLERAILRTAVYELLAEESVPVAVAVDEAVELAKRFCSVEAGSLVNGVLAGIAEKIRPPAIQKANDSEQAQ